MRRMAGLAIVLGCGAAGGACAQTLMTPPPAAAPALTLDSSASSTAPPAPMDEENLSRMLNREVFVAGEGPMRWSSGEAPISASGATTLRVGMGGVLRTPGGLPLNAGRAMGFQSDAYEVTVIHDWPSAVSFQKGKVGVDLTPHAGLGMTSSGTSAEAGARLELSQRRDQAAVDRLKSLGVHDGSSFGDTGRWYLYAAASGRAVGLNMLHGDGGWDRAGWTTDPTSTLISDAQLGVGWRKGIMQTSFGYLHREVKGQHMIFGQQTRDDSLVAFTLSIKPQR